MIIIQVQAWWIGLAIAALPLVAISALAFAVIYREFGAKFIAQVIGLTLGVLAILCVIVCGVRLMITGIIWEFDVDAVFVGWIMLMIGPFALLAVLLAAAFYIAWKPFRWKGVIAVILILGLVAASIGGKTLKDMGVQANRDAECEAAAGGR